MPRSNVGSSKNGLLGSMDRWSGGVSVISNSLFGDQVHGFDLEHFAEFAFPDGELAGCRRVCKGDRRYRGDGLAVQHVGDRAQRLAFRHAVAQRDG